MENVSTYNSYAEASLAARALNIKSSTEYRKVHKLDSRLPYSPEKVYVDGWTGWPAFLGTKRQRGIAIPSQYHATYSQARRAVRLLGIDSKSEYQSRFRRDKKLPADPESIYGGYWKGWERFLSKTQGVDRTIQIYKTLAKASKAAKALSPKSAREYIKLYQKDKGLPSNPATYYDNWIDWHHFLGTVRQEDKYYKKLSIASAAARALNIKSARDYIKRYRLDNKFPSTPYQFYEDWISWDSFLKIKR